MERSWDQRETTRYAKWPNGLTNTVLGISGGWVLTCWYADQRSSIEKIREPWGLSIWTSVCEIRKLLRTIFLFRTLCSTQNRNSLSFLGGEAHSIPRGTYSGEWNIGIEVLAQVSQLQRSQTWRIFKGLERRAFSLAKINVVINHMFSRETLRQFCRSDFSKVFDNFLLQAFKWSSEPLIQL